MKYPAETIAAVKRSLSATNGKRQEQIAAEHCVSRSLVSDIWTGRCHADEMSRTTLHPDASSRVLVIGDTHCPGMRKGYIDFLKRIADGYSVNRVVHIGDLVDWASISYHEKMPTLSNASAEYKKAKKQVSKLVKAFPQADWLIGNHDALTSRQAHTAGLPTEILRDYGDLWDVPWTVHPRFAKLTIDNVIYSHGDSGAAGKGAAFRQAKDNFRSTVIGHFHSQAGVNWWANPEYRVFSMSVGCGIDAAKLQFEYGRKFPSKPILGCGVVIDGRKAYFEPWLLKSR
jgi:metallophosphoesterase superfamily enzyme